MLVHLASSRKFIGRLAHKLGKPRIYIKAKVPGKKTGTFLTARITADPLPINQTQTTVTF